MTDFLIFDQNRIEQFRSRAFMRYGNKGDFLLRRITEELQERLQTVDRKFSHAVDLFGHTGAGAEALVNSGKVSNVDSVESDGRYTNGKHVFLQRDREIIDLPTGAYDLAISLLSLSITNDVPGVLTQIRNSLKPDGLFLGVMAGAGTLGELRESMLEAENELYGGASPRIYPFVDIRDAGGLLQRAGFAMPVSDVENLTVRYDTVFHLIDDLRAMGMQNALIGRSHRPVSRRFFQRVAEIYADRFSDNDGRIRASFSFIWLSGWAPDKSQQKPTRPGTATISLVDVLGDKSAH